MVRLAQEFSPLMAIISAIAALDIGNDALAMQHYLRSLRSLQGRLIGASGTWNEDGLLATTICLCVFEVSFLPFSFVLNPRYRPGLR